MRFAPWLARVIRTGALIAPILFGLLRFSVPAWRGRPKRCVINWRADPRHHPIAKPAPQGGYTRTRGTSGCWPNTIMALQPQR